MATSFKLSFAFLVAFCFAAFGTCANSLQAQELLIESKAVASHIDNIRVPTEEAGVVRAFQVKEGDLVEVAQHLVELNSEVQQLQVAVAEAEVEAAALTASNTSNIEYAEKSGELSRKTLERSTQANQRSNRAVSKTEIERLQLEFERGILASKQARMEMSIANAQLSVKQAELRAAKMKLDRRRITSPINGKVVERLAQAGEWVNAGQPLLRIIRLDRLRVKCIVSAKEFDESLVGNRVEFEVEVPPNGVNMVFEGLVTFVSPEVILQRDQIAVWAEVENTDMKLRPNNSGVLKIYAK